MRRGALLGALLLLAACSEPAAEPTDETRRDVLYALGGWLARDLAGVKIEPADLPEIEAGLADALLRRPLRVQPKDVAPLVQKFLGDRRAATAADEKRAGAPLLAEALARPGARRTPNGVVFESLAEGEGEPPALLDTVRVHYVGSLRDGSVFDSTRERGRPAELGMTNVIPCWTEALPLVRPGGKARLTCPADLAYGERGLPGAILPGAVLQFEIELLEVKRAPEAEAAR